MAEEGLAGHFPKSVYLLAGLVFITIFFSAWVFADSPRMSLVLQSLSSNWSPPNNFNDITRLEYALSAVFAILVNWGTLIAAFVLIYGYFSRLILHEVDMTKVKHILDVEDTAIKVAILSRIEPTPENQRLVNEAFEEAAKAKDEMIEATFGKKAAEKFKKLLSKKL